MMTPLASRRLSSSGFTLAELLIVIAVIAILAAVLFPVFARARESARRTACLSSMKQIGLGMMQYLQDYDETFPRQFGNVYYFNSVSTPDPATGYYANGGNSSVTSPSPSGSVNFLYAVEPYVKANGSSVYTCPSATNVPTDLCPSGVNSSSCWTATKTNSTSYVMNGVIVRSAYNIGTAVVQLPLKAAAIPNAADIAIMQEYMWKMNGSTLRPRWDAVSKYQYWHWYSSAPYGDGTKEPLSNRHFDGGVLLFCDGHAKWRKLIGLTDKDFGLTCPSPTNTYNTTNPLSCDASF